ncbi:regulatory protein, Fis family [Desulfotomaculum arcticum]|uniref:Regulatory protein, Fis family n=1 Tax=Desulfotruncus arcticus DSM 17038 TaxID=1121424 RepID=A0A1I2UUD9_9FIRM|nr:sigma 54-interacting transcriptional regulator [Desulfotruncus arcticus]SFG80742.1 regulatory protein, Fis family [Desulfotomaculum arcticum] [Desulfotruncus arcticus DSM 17038]
MTSFVVTKQRLDDNNMINKTPIIAQSVEMKELLRTAMQVAKVDCTVLLLGESGTGKEVLAKLIHKYSERSGPLVKVNCGAIPETLLESELFGYEYGAFTGAKREGSAGKFEQAHKGIILLDEIGDLPLHLQVKLLRILQEKEVIRIGSSKAKPIDTRVIAATNKNLYKMVQEGKFREDLFYRLNVIPLKIPPLRERRGDIMPLIYFFKKKFEQKYKHKMNCSSEVIRVFMSYDWPGNVRELENVIERIYVISAPGELVTQEILIRDYLNIHREKQLTKTISVHGLTSLKTAVEEVERQLITIALNEFKTLKQVALALNVDESTVSRKIKKLNIPLR